MEDWMVGVLIAVLVVGIANLVMLIHVQADSHDDHVVTRSKVETLASDVDLVQATVTKNQVMIEKLEHDQANRWRGQTSPPAVKGATK